MKLTVREMVYTALMAALVCVLSIVSIPIGTVPVTLQTFVVALAGYLLGAKLGAVAMVVYVLLGAVGLPVFAGMKGGLATLAGPTGGFIVGFIGMAALCGLGKERVWWQRLPAGLAGLLVVYVLGAAWLAHAAGLTAGQAIMAGVTPFIVKDVISVAAASFLAAAAEKILASSAAGPRP